MCDHHHEHHGHAHEHSHAEQNELLLTYMLEHNEHHMKELLECAHGLTHKGLSAAAKYVEESANFLQQSNEKLAEAIALLKDGD